MSRPATTQATIPQHLLERNESEWRQMQTGREAQPKPPVPAGQA